jgi:tetratricopeptide (TPR) repeat protein
VSLKDNPKVDIYIDDILSHLTYSDQKYDLISSDGKFGPLNRSNTTMLSQEYYELCKEHLSEKGLFIQWITTEMPSKNFRTILQTTQDVFPHSELFLIRKNLYIISSLEPVALEENRINKGFENKVLTEDFFASYIFTPQEVLAYYAGPNWNTTEESLTRNSLNTPVIEYDYNIEREKDIQKGRTSFYVNFDYLYTNLLNNEARILASENTITANKSKVSYELNRKYMNSRKAYFQAHFAMQDQQLNDMLRFFQEVVDDDHPDNNNNIAVSAKYIGEYYFQQKNYKKALAYFDYATKKMDGYSAAFTMKGLVYYYQQDTAAARTNLEKALSLDSSDETAKQFLEAIK